MQAQLLFAHQYFPLGSKCNRTRSTAVAWWQNSNLIDYLFRCLRATANPLRWHAEEAFKQISKRFDRPNHWDAVVRVIIDQQMALQDREQFLTCIARIIFILGQGCRTAFRPKRANLGALSSVPIKLHQDFTLLSRVFAYANMAAMLWKPHSARAHKPKKAERSFLQHLQVGSSAPRRLAAAPSKTPLLWMRNTKPFAGGKSRRIATKHCWTMLPYRNMTPKRICSSTLQKNPLPHPALHASFPYSRKNTEPTFTKPRAAHCKAVDLCMSGKINILFEVVH